MQKLMVEFDTEKNSKVSEMSYKGTKGGAPGGKEGKPRKAALRNLANSI